MEVYWSNDSIIGLKSTKSLIASRYLRNTASVDNIAIARLKIPIDFNYAGLIF